jgi:hypothetical protein
MGRHHSIFGDIKSAFHDVEHKVEHSPVINSVIHDVKDASKTVVNTVKDPNFQSSFGQGFKMGAGFAVDNLVPIALPEVGLAMDAVKEGPSLFSSVTSSISSVGNSVSSVSSIGSALTNPLDTVMPYLPIIGGVVGLLILYKVMKKK